MKNRFKALMATALAVVVASTVAVVPAQAAPGDSIVVIGDSYSAGYEGYGEGANGWPAIMADRFGLDLYLNAVPGTGYVKTTNGLANAYANRWRAGLTADTDYVMIAGSKNDKDQDPQAVYSKTRATINAVRTVSPNAVVMVVGPMWGAGDEPAYVQAVEDAVRNASNASEAKFVDGSYWMSSHPTLLTPSQHPTNGGHKVLAKYIGDAFSWKLSQ